MARQNERQLLTEKELAFVRAWAGDPTQAAISAGYSEKTATQAASKLLRKPAVVRALLQKQQAMLALDGRHVGEMLAEHDLSIELLCSELGAVIRQKPRKGEAMAKVRALELLADIYGLRDHRGRELRQGQITRPDGTVEIYQSKWMREAQAAAALPPPVFPSRTE